MAFEGTRGNSSNALRNRIMLKANRSKLALGTVAACLQGACTLLSPSDQTYVGGSAVAHAGASARAGSANGSDAGFSNNGEAGDAAGGTSGNESGIGGAGGSPATYIAFDVIAAAALPAKYQVKYVFDSKPYIQSGTLDAACANVIVRGNASSGCDAVLPSWVSPESCGTQQTELWVQVPLLGFGSEIRFVVQLGEKPEQAFGPGDVFDFFDGFDGTTLDSAWLSLPSNGNAISVKGGELTSAGAAAIQSKTAWLKPGQTAYGVRIQAQTSGANPELAGGAVTSPALPATQRAWNGLGILSGSDGFAQGTLPALIAACVGDSADNMLKGPAYNWAYSSAVSAKYQLAEFRYDQASGKSTSTLTTSRGYNATWTVGQSCTTPASLPILIVLDDATAAAGNADPTQRIDYVYVRKDSKSPPTIVAKGVSSGLDCGLVKP